MEWQKPGLKIYPLRPVGTEPILSVNFQWYALPFFFHRNNRCKTRRFFLMFTIFKCTEFNGVHVICVRTLAHITVAHDYMHLLNWMLYWSGYQTTLSRLSGWISFCEVHLAVSCLGNNSDLRDGERVISGSIALNVLACYGTFVIYCVSLIYFFPRFKFQFITSWNSLIIPK